MSRLMLSFTVQVYWLSLFLYPASFRRQYGPDMLQAFRDVCRQSIAQNGVIGVVGRCAYELRDVVMTAPAEYRAAQDAPEAESPAFEWWPFLRETASSILTAVVIFLVVELFTPRYLVEGKSMQPNLDDGQRLIAGRMGVFPGEVQRGGIVVLRYPAQPKDEPPLIKRLIGLPGDVIAIRNQQVYVNEVALDEPYINEPCDQWHCPDNQWILGDDEYFVMGDNRNHSNDSRRFGPITGDYLYSRILFRYWPLPDLGFLFPTQ